MRGFNIACDEIPTREFQCLVVHDSQATMSINTSWKASVGEELLYHKDGNHTSVPSYLRLHRGR